MAKHNAKRLTKERVAALVKVLPKKPDQVPTFMGCSPVMRTRPSVISEDVIKFVLSARELGYSYKQIGHRIGISSQTIGSAVRRHQSKKKSK
jgi:hypothetical protein